MRKFFNWIFNHLDARDVHAYTGITLITAGVAQIHKPSAFIVSGVLLLYLALREVKV